MIDTHSTTVYECSVIVEQRIIDNDRIISSELVESNEETTTDCTCCVISEVSVQYLYRVVYCMVLKH